MKVNITVSYEEAQKIIKGAVASIDFSGNTTEVGSVTIERDPVAGYSLRNSEIARANKIELIKLVRKLSEDIYSGKVDKKTLDSVVVCMGLAEAKTYVEEYFNM